MLPLMPQAHVPITGRVTRGTCLAPHRRDKSMSIAPVPERRTLRTLKMAARTCRACHLWRTATQTVFGEGPVSADVMFVGEQPGNEEDLAGHPFVGPAGRVLDEALAEAGIDRGRTYVTNVVKHFKWEARGKRRIHAKPKAGEIGACRPWLDAEIAVVHPRVVVCLGATAAKALLGAAFKVSVERGRFVASPLAPLVTATVPPIVDPSRAGLERPPPGDARVCE